LIWVSCGDTSALTLTALNPADGKTLSSISLDFRKFPGVSRCAAGDGLDLLQLREQFDTDYTRVTATVMQQDGSNHVGFYDLRTGAFTDLTAKRVSRDSFAPLPQEGGPLFHPTTDTFWYEARVPGEPYLRDIHAFVMDLKTGSSVDKGPVPGQVIGWGFVLPQRLETAVSRTPTGSYYSGVPNPSGTFFGAYSVRLPIKTDQISERDRVSSCAPVVWIDDDRAICGDDRLTFTSLLQFTADHRSATETKLLPATDRFNFSPIVSPNGTEIAFLSIRGGEHALYRMPLTAGANPTKIADLPALKGLLYPPAFIEWR
jgi:hypothetical protein